MKNVLKLLLLLLLLKFSPPVICQTNITNIEYYVDKDPGYGKAFPVSGITANPKINTSIAYDISALSIGLHIMGIRSKDANGVWSFDEPWMIYKPYPAAPSASNIIRIEYYLDNDPGYGNATTVPITAGLDLATMLTYPISTLSIGLHILYIRSKNANGAWSFDEPWMIYKPYPAAPVASNITRIEYYVDKDPGYGNATSVAINAGISIDTAFNYNISTLSTGLHILSIRSKNANGTWSFDEPWMIYKPLPASTASNIKQIEYYIDKDPGWGNATQLALQPGKDIPSLNAFVNITGLDTGMHIIAIRSKDSIGKWSFDDTISFRVNTKKATPFINVNSLAFINACSAGSFNLGYDATGTFNSENQFIAELSNATGSFASGTTVLKTVSSTTSGLINNCIMPPNTQLGTGYRLRVRSTSPAIASDSGTMSLSVDKKFLGKDTSVLVICSQGNYDITSIYNTNNCSLAWSVANPAMVHAGIYTLYATNALGCNDTALINLIAKQATWNGSTDSSWHNAANWTWVTGSAPGNIPDDSTLVTIPGGTPHRCVIYAADATASSINAINGGIFWIINDRKIIIKGRCQE